MRLYAAIDLHSNNNVLVVIDESDRVLVEKRLPNDINAVLAYLAPHKERIEAVAVESTYNWYWLVDGLIDADYSVKLVNTCEVKVYEGKKFSGDEHDARHLAHLMRLGLLPTGYIYPKEERAVRDLLRKRAHLVRARTSQLLSIKNMVSRNTGKGIAADDVYHLDEKAISEVCAGQVHRELAIKASLAVVRCIDEQISQVEKAVLAQARLRPEFKKLLTVSGVGNILAMTIMFEAGTMDRFARIGNFSSYARCVKSGWWSNGKKKAEGNRKNGNKYLAWAFIEAANAAIRYDERIRRFYQRKKAKRHVMIARKAIAHKIARASFHVLKDQVDFDVARAFN
jgi:transposase